MKIELVPADISRFFFLVLIIFTRIKYIKNAINLKKKIMSQTFSQSQDQITSFSS